MDIRAEARAERYRIRWEYKHGYVETEQAENFLNELGEEGWELVSFEFPREDDTDPGTHCGYVMKRKGE